MRDKKDLMNLSNEITYHRYVLSHKKVENLYKDMSMSEYIALKNISGAEDGEKIYLNDIANKLEITVPQASRAVRKLADRGLVLWEHDGNGSEGTYVTVTDSGKTLLSEQQNILSDYYGKVVSIFGEERLKELLSLLGELEEAMDTALSGEGGDNDD